MEYQQKSLIKEYKHWAVQAHPDQSLLGRCVLWCKRADAISLEEASSEEQIELFQILKDIKSALNETFQPDLINYTFLGNVTNHLHGHLIPRYKTEREFMNQTFIDKKWGHNPYRSNDTSPVDEDIQEEVRKTLAEILNNKKS
jgi:diadenosine tetraphosphate (Ap4A) HIT family hydrolase